jgi:uncharacterized protein with FMN-binding domain
MLTNTKIRIFTRLLASVALVPLLAGAAMAAGVAMPPGTHLQDGDFVSEPYTFEWGTLQLKLTIHDGAITDAQAVQMPAHRSRSVELSEYSKPILLSEAIKSQKAAVNIVSSATLTSLAFQTAMASALAKATVH